MLPTLAFVVREPGREERCVRFDDSRLPILTIGRDELEAIRLADLEGLYQELLNERGFTTQEQHCKMYVELFAGTALWNDDDYLSLGAEGCAAYPVQ